MATQAVASPTPVDGSLEDSLPEKDGYRQQFIDWQQPQVAQPGEGVDTTIEEEGAGESYQQGTEQESSSRGQGWLVDAKEQQTKQEGDA